MDCQEDLMEKWRQKRKDESEGGCGVIGAACSEQIAGKHLLRALIQMRNRGNGKGGGIAAAGLCPEAFGISQEMLQSHYLLAIAYLDIGCRETLEKEFIHPTFETGHIFHMPHLADFRQLPGIDVPPPEAILYFVRVRDEAITQFKQLHPENTLDRQAIEEEIVYKNTYRLNAAFYAAEGSKSAFVLSHGKNLLVLKMVGFGDDVIRYYQLEEFKAHVWIGHHRYPTKGRVWHPGGAHPFIGLNEALVHNGDFANYYSLCEYLQQQGIHPLFLTDTEAAVLLFDLLYRTYRYPLEYVIEAVAPTTERDFTLLAENKQRIYKMLQTTHMHSSPDGPWFFLIAQSLLQAGDDPCYRLIGITDTSMLRPQVFALQTGSVSIGFAASEKQAIDATLKSLSESDSRFWSEADRYWVARGGSYTNGGAFIFNVRTDAQGTTSLSCTDKFGNAVSVESLTPTCSSTSTAQIDQVPDLRADHLFSWAKEQIPLWSYPQFCGFLQLLIETALEDHLRERTFAVLTWLLDRRYPLGTKRRSCVTAFLNQAINLLAQSVKHSQSTAYAYADAANRHVHPTGPDQMLLINAEGFPAQGRESLALEIVRQYKNGFKKFLIFNSQGQRFIGNGLGPRSHGVHIDVYGSSGDYAASGIDGAEIIIHGSAQDQLCQIMKDGTFVVHGDAGQTFLYGAKGGYAFILGNVAGRTLINAAGKPRVVINGTCLDYLAESFMAGNPLEGGGFAILNGLQIDEEGNISDLDTPYPGSNLFALASGGAIYVRDPARKIVHEQLNGGGFAAMTEQDWEVLLPLLRKNEELFNIPIERLLRFEGQQHPPRHIYRKVQPAHTHLLQEEEAWVKGSS